MPALVTAMGEDGDRVASRFARGCRCFAVWDGGLLVSYGWLSVKPEWVGELCLQFAPGEREAYVWNCATIPSHRRRGMYRALVEGIVRRAREEGVARLWIGSIEDPAEKADADAGFVPVLHFTVTAAGPLRWLRVWPAPGAGVQLAEGARRQLGLGSWSVLGPVRSRTH